jgi:hypothetical protein
MPEEFVIRLNRREGSLEISGPDKEWINEKLKELSVVYEAEPPAKPARKAEDESAADKKEQQKTPRARKAAGRSSGRSQKNPALEKQMVSETKKKLQAWADARNKAFDSGLPAQAAILGAFLMDELQMGSIDSDDLYTLYSIMGWSIPGNPRAQLSNAQIRNGYFTGFKDGKTQLSHTGETFGRNGALNKPANK